MVVKVLSYIVFDWFIKYMDINCYVDVVDVLQGLKFIFLYQRLFLLLLQFKSMEVIQKCYYLLEFEKEFYFYWMKEFNVKWLLQLDVVNVKIMLFEVFFIIFINVVVFYVMGFYCVVMEVLEEFCGVGCYDVGEDGGENFGWCSFGVGDV